MDDIYEGGTILAANYKPIWTCWTHKTVAKHVKEHKRYCRRKYKHYLKTGDIRDYNKSQRLMTRRDFD
jgi:hypothetical protein